MYDVFHNTKYTRNIDTSQTTSKIKETLILPLNKCYSLVSLKNTNISLPLYHLFLPHIQKSAAAL